MDIITYGSVAALPWSIAESNKQAEASTGPVKGSLRFFIWDKGRSRPPSCLIRSFVTLPDSLLRYIAQFLFEEAQNLFVIPLDILLSDLTGKPDAVCGIATDITALKRAEEMQAAVARERELFAQQRAAELAKANEAVRGCLDALASVAELDDFLGQVMAAITWQLDSVSSSLRMLNLEQNTLTLELIFQDGRLMSPGEASYPEAARSLSPDEPGVATFLDRPTTVIHLLDPHSPIAEAQRSYLLGLGIKTLLIIPLSSGGKVNGRLDFRSNEERTFDPDELEIARALATQAGLAIQLTRLAKTARQSAELENQGLLRVEGSRSTGAPASSERSQYA